MSRRVIPQLTLALVGILSLAAIAVSLHTSGAAPSPPNPVGSPQFGFGGYVVLENTKEIGGQWRVPAIKATSPLSEAATWVGAENNVGQFIQLGTVEIKDVDAPTYEVFWSDVTVHFSPQELFSVKVGDLVTYTMVQTSTGWRLSADDRTTKKTDSLTVPYGGDAVFQEAAWLQEDPTDILNPAIHTPYPTMSEPTFRHLTLNQKKPHLPLDNRQVLSTSDGTYLVPTAYRHGQFTLDHATGPARQYLSDVFAYNQALYPFQVDILQKHSPSREVLDHLQSTLATLGRELRTQSWPKRLANAVKGDEIFVADNAKAFAKFSVAPAPLNTQEITQFATVIRSDQRYPDAIRQQLGLPPTR